MLAKDEELEQVKQRQLETQQMLQTFESKQQQVCDMRIRTTHSYTLLLASGRGGGAVPSAGGSLTYPDANEETGLATAFCGRDTQGHF